MILLIGGYGNGNFGDDALLEIILGIIARRLPGVRVLFNARRRRLVRFATKKFPFAVCLPTNALKMPGSSLLGRALRRVSCVVYGGGSQFYSFRRTGLRRALSFPGQASAAALFVAGEARLRNVPVFGFCLGLGPFEGLSANLVTRLLLRCFEDISLRDEGAFSVAKRLGFRGPRAASDPIFTLAESFRAERSVGNRLGVVVRRWPRKRGGWPLRRLGQLCGMVAKRGVEIDLVTLGGHSDSEAVDACRAFAGNPSGLGRVDWDPTKNSVEAFSRALGRYGLLVSMRLHAVLAAACVGVPSIVLDIDPKLSGAIRMLGLPERMIAGDNLRAEELAKLTTEGLSRTEEYGRQLRSRALELGNRVELEASKLASLIAAAEKQRRR